MATPSNKSKGTFAKVYRPSFLDTTGDLRPSVERELYSISESFKTLINKFKFYPLDTDGFFIYPSGGGPGGGGLISFNGRTNPNVIPASGDYALSQITGGSDVAIKTATNVFTTTNTFNLYPVVPTTLADPTLPNQLVTKKYVDAHTTPLPVASSTVLGGIKVGSGLSINAAGVLSVTGAGNGTNVVVDSFIGSVEWFNGPRDKIPSWFIPADGEEYDRAAYPELWDKVSDGTFIAVTEALWQDSGDVKYPVNNRGKYSFGSVGTKFRVPDLNGSQAGSTAGLFLRGSGKTNEAALGIAAPPGLPNITGAISHSIYTGAANNNETLKNGALSSTTSATGVSFPGNTAPLGTRNIIYPKLNAADSNTIYGDSSEVRPSNASGVWVIRAKTINGDALTTKSNATVDGDFEFTKVVKGVDPVADEDFATKAYVDNHSSVGNPTNVLVDTFIGSIEWWGGDRAHIPAGYVAADGTTLLSRTAYPELWKAVSYGILPSVTDAAWIADLQSRGKYSTGDGSTNFRLPDLNAKYTGSVQGLFLRGEHNQLTTGLVYESGLPNITGRIYGLWSSSLTAPQGAFQQGSVESVHVTNTNDAAQRGTSTWALNASTQSPIYKSNVSETRPPSVIGMWIIRAESIHGASANTTNIIMNNFLGSVHWFNGDRNSIPKGYAAADGDELQRSAYPDLWGLVSNNKLNAVTEALWQDSGISNNHVSNRGMYSTGDGTTTFRLPDLNGTQTGSIPNVFLRGTSKGITNIPPGTTSDSALPNITGTYAAGGAVGVVNKANSIVSGVFGVGTADKAYGWPYVNHNISSNGSGNVTSNATTLVSNDLTFNASSFNPVYGRDNTGEVRPRAAWGIWIICVSSDVSLYGSLDLTNRSGTGSFQSSVREKVTATLGPAVGDGSFVYHGNATVSPAPGTRKNVMEWRDDEGPLFYVDRSTTDSTVAGRGVVDFTVVGQLNISQENKLPVGNGNYSLAYRNSDITTNDIAAPSIAYHGLISGRGSSNGTNGGWRGQVSYGFTHGEVSGTGHVWPHPVIVASQHDVIADGTNASNNECAWWIFNQTTGNITGQKTTGTAGSGFTITAAAASDERLKENIQEADTLVSLNNIDSLKFRTFDFKADKGTGKPPRRGIIAQEAMTVDPEYVHLNHVPIPGDEEDHEWYSLDSNVLLLDALAAIQNLSTQVKELTKRVAELESK